MVIFEDLHWIDDETQAFLNLLADSIGTARILMLVNYRPEYRHEWGHKTYYTQLRLDPLGQESADEMLASLLGDDVSLSPLKRLIIETDRGQSVLHGRDGAGAVGSGCAGPQRQRSNWRVRSTEMKIPPTVQGILASRIDRLASDEKGAVADACGAWARNSRWRWCGGYANCRTMSWIGC